MRHGCAPHSPSQGNDVVSTDSPSVSALRPSADGVQSTALVQVRAQTVLVGDGSHTARRHVVVSIDGPGPARHVLVRLVRSLDPGRPVALEEVPSVDGLAPHSRMVVGVLSAASGPVPAIEVAVVWSDDAGRHELVRQLVFGGA